MGVAGRGQVVVVLRGRHLDGLQRHLGGQAADDDGEVVRRARRRAAARRRWRSVEGKRGKAPSAHNWDTHMVLMLSSRNFMSDVGLSRALVCWYRYVLLADPPPWTTFAHTHANTRSTQDVGEKRGRERRHRTCVKGRTLAMKRNSYLDPGVAYSSICGRKDGRSSQQRRDTGRADRCTP
jgi:hypothetical protein